VTTSRNALCPTPEADARITLRLTRQGMRCTGAARQRVCARMTTVLA
jgi:hypothetical protein